MKHEITEDLIDALSNIVQGGISGKAFEAHQSLCELRRIAKRAVRQRESLCEAVSQAMFNANHAVSAAIINAINMPDDDCVKTEKKFGVINGGKNEI